MGKVYMSRQTNEKFLEVLGSINDLVFVDSEEKRLEMYQDIRESYLDLFDAVNREMKYK